MNIKTIYWMLVLVIGFNACCMAQLYPGPVHQFYQNGSGDQVWPSATFGSGTSRGANFASPEISGYSNSAAGTLSAGQFASTSSTAGLINAPVHVTTDHTGDNNGRMLVVNGSSPNNIIYQNAISSLCQYQGYELSAWLMNLSSQGGVPVNITFNVRMIDGTLLKSYQVDIQPLQSPQWKQEGTYFNVGTETSVIIQILNNTPSTTTANFLAVDDISLNVCEAVASIGIDSENNKAVSACIVNGQKKFALQSTLYPLYQTSALQWQVSFNSTPPVDIPGATSLTYDVDITGKPPGSYNYNLLVGPSYTTGAQGKTLLCSGGAGGLAIVVKLPPVVFVSNNGPLCSGGTLKLTVNGGGSSYHWTGPNNFNSFLPNPNIPNVDERNSGTYTLVVDEGEGFCSTTVTTTAVITNLPIVTVSPDVIICDGENTQLLASGGASYSWSPSTGLSNSTSASPIASPLVTTTYTVTVQASANASCTSKGTVTVKVGSKPVIKAGKDKSILIGSSTTINASISGVGYTYMWTPTDFLDDPFKLNPRAAPLRDIVYTLTAFSADGCGPVSDAVNIRVRTEFTIPNAFSPNGDGVNDKWNIVGLDTYTSAIVSVYNRYGNLVYRSVGYAVPWDGNIKSRALPAGNYYYLIDLKTGESIISGSLIIIK